MILFPTRVVRILMNQPGIGIYCSLLEQIQIHCIEYERPVRIAS